MLPANPASRVEAYSQSFAEHQQLVVKCLATLGLVAPWFMWKSLKGSTSPNHVRTEPARAQIIFALLVVRVKVLKGASKIHINPRHLKSTLRKTRGWFAQISDFHVCNLPARKVHPVWTVGSELFVVRPQSSSANFRLWLLVWFFYKHLPLS